MLRKLEIIKKLVKEFLVRYQEELLFLGITDKKGLDAQIEYLKLCNSYLASADISNAFRIINQIDFKSIAENSARDKKIDEIYFEFEKQVAKLMIIQSLKTQLLLDFNKKQEGQVLH